MHRSMPFTFSVLGLSLLNLGLKNAMALPIQTVGWNLSGNSPKTTSIKNARIKINSESTKKELSISNMFSAQTHPFEKTLKTSYSP
jgi:hypothetical protein